MSEPCGPSCGSFHALLVLTVPVLFVMLTVWIRPYLLTFLIPINYAYGVSDILDSLQAPASISDSDSNTDHVLSTALMDTSSNSDSLSDFSQFFNMIYPLSTLRLFTCYFNQFFLFNDVFSSVTYALYF